MTPVRNLVLGSSGLVGRSLCNYLRNKGDIVYEYDIKNSVACDLRYSQLSFKEVDRVYILAWDVGGARYLYQENNQLHQLQWNLDILSNVMPQLERAKIPFLFVSSQHAGRYTAYGQTKRIGEYWAQSIGGTVVRLWNVYGEREEEGDRTHVLGDMISQAIKTNEIHLLTTGEEERWFVFSDDVNKGLELAMETTPKDIYDIAGYSPTKIMRAAKLVQLETNAAIFAGETKGTDGDFEKPHHLPGFVPRIYIREGIRRMVEQYKEKQQ